MPRSSYIYIVRDEHGVVYAAFTVKKEAVSYIREKGWMANRWTVLRFRDGVSVSRAVFGAAEFIGVKGL